MVETTTKMASEDADPVQKMASEDADPTKKIASEDDDPGSLDAVISRLLLDDGGGGGGDEVEEEARQDQEDGMVFQKVATSVQDTKSRPWSDMATELLESIAVFVDLDSRRSMSWSCQEWRKSILCPPRPAVLEPVSRVAGQPLTMKILLPLSCPVAVRKSLGAHSLLKPPVYFVLEDPKFPTITLPFGLRIVGGGAPNCPPLFVDADSRALVLLHVFTRPGQMGVDASFMSVGLPPKIKAGDIYIGHASDNTDLREIQILIATPESLWGTIVGHGGCHRPWSAVSVSDLEKFESIIVRGRTTYLISRTDKLSSVVWVTGGIRVDTLDVAGSEAFHGPLMTPLNRYSRAWLALLPRSMMTSLPRVIYVIYSSDTSYGYFTTYLLNTAEDGKMRWSEYNIEDDYAVFIAWSPQLSSFGWLEPDMIGLHGGLVYCSMYARPGLKMLAYRSRGPLYRRGRNQRSQDREIHLPTHVIPWPFRIWIHLDNKPSTKVGTINGAENGESVETSTP